MVKQWIKEKTVSFGHFMWKGDSEETKKPVPHWFHFGLQICVGAFALYWHWHLPAPNKAVLALASVAALMVLAEMRPIHKAVYFFLIVALVFTENRAIDKDRRDFAENEAGRREQENAQFQKIADGLSSSIQLNQQQFAETKSGIERSIATVTGGKSFAIVTPQVWSGMVPIPLSIYNYGNQTLTGVTVNIYGKEEWNKPRGLFEAPTINVGTLHAGEMKLLKESITPSPDSGFSDNGLKVDRFQIHIAAQNFTVVEYLDFRQGKKIPWTFRYVVTRQFVKSRRSKTTNFGYETMANAKNWMGEN